MKKDEKFLWWGIGGIALYVILRKPLYKAAWSLWTGPNFYASISTVIKSNDPAQIARLYQKYNESPTEVQQQIDDTIRKLGLKRPW